MRWHAEKKQKQLKEFACVIQGTGVEWGSMMTPRLYRTDYDIPTMWGTSPITRVVGRRGQDFCSLRVNGRYLGYEWWDGSMTLNGTIYWMT